MPTRWPSLARDSARLITTDVLPTPPFPLVIVMMVPREGLVGNGVMSVKGGRRRVAEHAGGQQVRGRRSEILRNTLAGTEIGNGNVDVAQHAHERRQRLDFIELRQHQPRWLRNGVAVDETT